MRTRKQLAETLNKINNRNDIKIKKDGDMYIVVIGGYESAIWGYLYWLMSFVTTVIILEVLIKCYTYL